MTVKYHRYRASQYRRICQVIGSTTRDLTTRYLLDLGGEYLAEFFIGFDQQKVIGML